ncbi:MAG: PEP-CTERM sorting domain-containing protein [Planctomycetota bacterium]
MRFLSLLAAASAVCVLTSEANAYLATSAPLLNPLGNYSELRFLGTPGVSNTKVWSLDDFSITARGIPEPASVFLLGSLGLFGISSRRR